MARVRSVLGAEGGVTSVVPTPFTVPFRGERTLDTLLIGGVLHILAVYVPVVPLVIVVGYLLTLLGAVTTLGRTDRLESLPRFGLDRSLVRTGLGGSVVVVAYLLPAVLTLLITVAGTTRRSLTVETIDIGTSMGFVLGSTTALLLAVVFVYLLPAALANYVLEGRLRAAFAFGHLRRTASDAAYFYNTVVGIVFGALALSLSAPLFPIAVGFFLAFYGEIVAVSYWGRGLRQVRSTTSASGAVDDNAVDGLDE